MLNRIGPNFGNTGEHKVDLLALCATVVSDEAHDVVMIVKCHVHGSGTAYKRLSVLRDAHMQGRLLPLSQFGSTLECAEEADRAHHVVEDQERLIVVKDWIVVREALVVAHSIESLERRDARL
jgi:hypothetical protein